MEGFKSVFLLIAVYNVKRDLVGYNNSEIIIVKIKASAVNNKVTRKINNLYINHPAHIRVGNS